MSKQSNEVRKSLQILFDDFGEEIDISKIVKSPLYKGIIVDFWLPDINCAIEIHGKQHESVQSFGSNKIQAISKFNRQLDRDSRLRSICERFGVNYVEIWYNEPSDLNSVYNKLKDYME